MTTPPDDPHDPMDAPPPGGFGQAPGAALQHVASEDAQLPEKARRGEALVRLSTWLLAGGFLFIIVAAFGTIALGTSIGGIGVVLGLVVVVVAAVVGQVGRGLQGRVL